MQYNTGIACKPNWWTETVAPTNGIAIAVLGMPSMSDVQRASKLGAGDEVAQVFRSVMASRVRAVRRPRDALVRTNKDSRGRSTSAGRSYRRPRRWNADSTQVTNSPLPLSFPGARGETLSRRCLPVLRASDPGTSSAPGSYPKASDLGGDCPWLHRHLDTASAHNGHAENALPSAHRPLEPVRNRKRPAVAQGRWCLACRHTHDSSGGPRRRTGPVRAICRYGMTKGQ